MGSIPFAEADRIAQLYTLQLGKVKAVAKGVRKPRSRLASSMDLFTESGFSLHKRAHSELYVLTQAKVLHGHSELKADFPALTSLQVLADMLEKAIHDTEPHPEVYSLLQETLLALGKGREGKELFLAAFALKLLELLGYPLELDLCAGCGSSLRRKKAHLIPHRGGALCESCFPAGPKRLQASPAGMEILKKIRSLPMGKVHVVKLRPALLRELFLTVLEYLQRTIEKRLQTVDYYLKVMPATP